MISELGIIVGVIFARGGSKGIPRKNIRPLAGKPLIAYAINSARASQLIDRVIVSTDDEEIARVAKDYGAEVPFMRPAKLAQDDSPEWLSWQHAIREIENVYPGSVIKGFISIPPTSPFRSVDDIDACIKMLMTTDADIVITVKPASHNPYFNMVVLDEHNFAKLVISPNEPVYHRQTAPVIYDMTTVAYAARPAFVLRHSAIFQGNVRAVIIPPERALDIDSELDFQFAEFLMERFIK